MHNKPEGGAILLHLGQLLLDLVLAQVISPLSARLSARLSASLLLWTVLWSPLDLNRNFTFYNTIILCYQFQSHIRILLFHQIQQYKGSSRNLNFFKFSPFHQVCMLELFWGVFPVQVGCHLQMTEL